MCANNKISRGNGIFAKESINFQFLQECNWFKQSSRNNFQSNRNIKIKGNDSLVSSSTTQTLYINSGNAWFYAKIFLWNNIFKNNTEVKLIDGLLQVPGCVFSPRTDNNNHMFNMEVYITTRHQSLQSTIINISNHNKIK